MRYAWTCGLLILLGLIGFSQKTFADEGQYTSFQVSLFHPLQLFPDTYNVDGLRINFLYGLNDNLQGTDIGIVNETQGFVHGLQIGLDNRVAHEFDGVQLGLFNQVKRDFIGVELGALANISRSCEGVQVAVFYNDAQEEMDGFQLGLVNHTGSLRGLQIGLVNFNDDMRYKGFMPFINAAF